MSEQHGVSEFAAVWHRDGARVAAYARRHVPAADVDDVVAETFLQAWRRWDTVPQPPIAWLIGTARKVIGNHRRAAGRREALRGRLELGAVARSAADAGLLATDRMSALGALAGLPESQRECLLLVAWDGLLPDEAATVLGVRPGAFRVRLHRAREALAREASSHRPPTRTGIAVQGVQE